jgi:hypothetical protein
MFKIRLEQSINLDCFHRSIFERTAEFNDFTDGTPAGDVCHPLIDLQSLPYIISKILSCIR